MNMLPGAEVGTNDPVALGGEVPITTPGPHNKVPQSGHVTSGSIVIVNGFWHVTP